MSRVHSVNEFQLKRAMLSKQLTQNYAKMNDDTMPLFSRKFLAFIYNRLLKTWLNNFLKCHTCLRFKTSLELDKDRVDAILLENSLASLLPAQAWVPTVDLIRFSVTSTTWHRRFKRIVIGSATRCHETISYHGAVDFATI